LQRSIYVSSCLLLIFMGSMDCLTTVIGTLFFGAQEFNPVIAGLVSSNLGGFVALKLSMTVAIGVIFILAQKTLMRAHDQKSASFNFAVRMLKTAYFAIVLFFAIVVANNVLVILHLIV